MGDENSKKLILARRARFVAAALASVAATTTALAASVEACGGATTEPGDMDGGPQPCLSPTATAQPCLTQRIDDAGARDAARDDADLARDSGADGSKDAGPAPCLAPPKDR